MSARAIRRFVYASLLSVLPATLASAQTFIDTDFFCQNYGCVVVHDGVSFDLYDVFVFGSGGTVPSGQNLIENTLNPIEGTGPVEMVETGTIASIAPFPIGAAMNIVGIDRNGDGLPDLLPIDGNSNGYLDASDQLSPFVLGAQDDLVLADEVLTRSIFVTSTTDFSVTGRALARNVSGTVGAAIGLADISLLVGMTASGVDGGMAFGSQANASGVQVTRAVASLADIGGGPVTLVTFPRGPGIAQHAASNLPAQSVRIDLQYGLPGFDLSMGTGGASFDVELAFVNR